MVKLAMVSAWSLIAVFSVGASAVAAEPGGEGAAPRLGAEGDGSGGSLPRGPGHADYVKNMAYAATYTVPESVSDEELAEAAGEVWDVLHHMDPATQRAWVEYIQEHQDVLGDPAHPTEAGVERLMAGFLATRSSSPALAKSGGAGGYFPTAVGLILLRAFKEYIGLDSFLRVRRDGHNRRSDVSCRGFVIFVRKKVQRETGEFGALNACLQLLAKRFAALLSRDDFRQAVLRPASGSGKRINVVAALLQAQKHTAKAKSLLTIARQVEEEFEEHGVDAELVMFIHGEGADNMGKSLIVMASPIGKRRAQLEPVGFRADGKRVAIDPADLPKNPMLVLTPDDDPRLHVPMCPGGVPTPICGWWLY
ncbi:MAG: hypothetical protein R6U98_34800 [Pirellulaceae bacterium]